MAEIISIFGFEVSINTLIAFVIFLVIFFSIFSVSFKLRIHSKDEGDDDGCKHSKGKKKSWYSQLTAWWTSLGFGDPTKDNNHQVKQH